jgi:hypothetical protein
MGRIRSLAVGGLRIAGGLVFRALLATPKRQLNILRWTRGREFRHVHGVGVAWLDSHFGLIERGAPWLHRVGSDVWDFCTGGVQPFFRLEGGSRAGARCIREVTAVYGFDGTLLPLLRSLDQALPPAGWNLGTPALPQSWADLDPGYAATAEKLARHRTRWMTDRRVNPTWRPAEALDYPPDGEGTPPWGQPPLTPRMRVTWSSRGQATGWLGDPNKKRPTTREYVAVEVSESGVRELLEEALARYEHALTVTIKLAYYSNPNARAWRHRVPRNILPTRPGHWPRSEGENQKANLASGQLSAREHGSAP